MDMHDPSALSDRAARMLAHQAGATPTGLDGVELFRLDAPVARTAGAYNPSLCIILRGTKHAYLGGRAHRYTSGTYLTAAMPIPVEAEVRHASPDDPVIGMLINLESRTASELLVQVRSVTPEPPRPADVEAGLLVTEWDYAFTTALAAVLDVLDDSTKLGILGHGRLRELLFAAVTGPAGPVIRHYLGHSPHDVTGVLTHIRDNLAQPLNVDALATRAGLSRAAFDRHFKTITTMSPLKYIKALRLNDAATLIASGTDINRAAAMVGYVSPSQFSREFKRQFGETPRAWARSRDGATDPQSLSAAL